MSPNDMIKKSLVGERLNAIQFVMDYLQIHFNDRGFTFYIWPSIIVNNEEYRYGDVSYRDILCSLIDKKVNDVIIIDKEILVVEFEGLNRLKLNLNPENPEIVSEIGFYNDENENWYIFE